MYTIKVSPEMGRGLYATRKIGIGEVVAVCEILLLSPDDTIRVNETDLQYYTFKVNKLQDCLVLGDGEIFNHADGLGGVNANVVYQLETIDGRLKMVFTAVRVIDADAQLFIDYSADANVNIEKYVAKASLLG